MDEFEYFNKNSKGLFPKHKDLVELSEKILLGSGLFGTILVDAYSKNQITQMYESLKNICGKDDSRPFDTYGIYSYWDFYTKEILYIGLTNNLITRFTQHNNINSRRLQGNKSSKIKEYFLNKEKIGFSILLQPPIVQTEKYLFNKDREIRVIEGALLQSFINQYGRLPAWNDIEGDIVSRKSKLVSRYGDILEMLNLKKLGYLNAKCSIREVASDTEYQKLECDLNVIRSHMYQWKESFEEVVAKLINWNNFVASDGNISGVMSNIRLMKLLDNRDCKMNCVKITKGKKD